MRFRLSAHLHCPWLSTPSARNTVQIAPRQRRSTVFEPRLNPTALCDGQPKDKAAVHCGQPFGEMVDARDVAPASEWGHAAVMEPDETTVVQLP